MKRLAKPNPVIMGAVAIALILGVTGPALADYVINADKSVTFTTPAATNTARMTITYSAVTDTTKPMIRQGNVFTFTTEPLAPNWYRYCFFVDGVTDQDGLRMEDPSNPNEYFGPFAKQWSYFMLSGEETDFLETKNVPHGNVSKVWFYSSVMSSWRTMWVYTPPEYNKDNRKYPVLYLHHGSGNTGEEWIGNMRTNFILDNLIAEGKAVPMIAVMPTHNDIPENADPALSVYPIKEVINSIEPILEKQFRVLSGSKNRAVAGLSKGGGRTLQTMIQVPTFADYFLPLSQAWNASQIAYLENDHQDLLLALGANRNIKRLWISIGKDDAINQRVPGMLSLFDKYHVEYEFVQYEGAHFPDVWRHQLHDFAQFLFK
jgi:enterochelin esterase family protein